MKATSEHQQHWPVRVISGTCRRWRWSYVRRAGRRRRRLGLMVVGAVLSFAVAAQHAGPKGVDKGKVVAEIVVTESFGAFRNLARFVFLILAAADAEG